VKWFGKKKRYLIDCDWWEERKKVPVHDWKLKRKLTILREKRCRLKVRRKGSTYKRPTNGSKPPIDLDLATMKEHEYEERVAHEEPTYEGDSLFSTSLLGSA